MSPYPKLNQARSLDPAPRNLPCLAVALERVRKVQQCMLLRLEWSGSRPSNN